MAALSDLGTFLQNVGTRTARPAASTLSFVMFICAICLVVVGFVGYYSRVALTSEFQQSGNNIDYVFVQIHQINQDENELKQARKQLAEVRATGASNVLQVTAKAYASKEYDAYLTAESNLLLLLESTPTLKKDYLVQVSQLLDLTRPSLAQAQIVANPLFEESTSINDRAALYGKLSPATQAFQQAIVQFNAEYGNQIDALERVGKTEAEQIRLLIGDILARNPQWATKDDIEEYGLSQANVDPKKIQEIAEQRAVVSSYETALGWTAWLLHAPTIVATLMVTLATGWLGGVVGYMGASSRAGSATNTILSDVEASPGITLIRRSILGVTAALGIFLFAGSGLLVLSSQSAKNISSGSLELSPYFVAFLAFISGFLADDAFARLTRAGRALFQTNGGEGGPPAEAAAAAAATAETTPDSQ